MEFEFLLQLIVGIHVRLMQRLEFAVEIRKCLDDSVSEDVFLVPSRKRPPEILECMPIQESIDKNISTPVWNEVNSKKSCKTYIDELESLTRNKSLLMEI